jgi:hypothetical protein
MGHWVYACSRYPQLQVGSRAGGLRFRDGRFETNDEGQAAALDRLPPEYGVDLVSAPTDQRGDAGGGVGSGSGPEAGERPARSARKADWVAYAAAVDPDTTGLDDLTKDELIDLYGNGGSDG